MKKFTLKIKHEIGSAVPKCHSYMFRFLGTKRMMLVLKFDIVPFSISGRMGKIVTSAGIDDVDVHIPMTTRDVAAAFMVLKCF